MGYACCVGDQRKFPHDYFDYKSQQEREHSAESRDWTPVTVVVDRKEPGPDYFLPFVELKSSPLIAQG